MNYLILQDRSCLKNVMLGRLKLKYCKKILNRSSLVNIQTITARFDSAEKFALLPDKVDLLVIYVDSSNICDIANDFCFKKSVAFIDVGYIQEVAVLGPIIIPKRTPCYYCFKQNNMSDKNLDNTIYDAEIKIINNQYQAQSMGPVNMLAVSMASPDILKYLGNFAQVHAMNQRISLWSNDLRIQTQPYNYSNNCKICMHRGE